MLKSGTVTRLWKTFQGHSECINKKYESFKTSESWCSSDRERFVNKFFKNYCDKYIILIDKEIVGSRYDNFYYATDPMSIYSCSRKEQNYNVTENIYRHSKKYLHILSFRAQNEMYGCGYIEMDCNDVFGNSVHIRLDNSSLRHIQFREISEDNFDSVALLFVDDREDTEFKVTRYLTVDEMKSRKIKGDKLIKETITIFAKDTEEACKKTTNAIEVEV